MSGKNQKSINRPVYELDFTVSSHFNLRHSQVDKIALSHVANSAYGGRPFDQLSYTEKRFGGCCYTRQNFDTCPVGQWLAFSGVAYLLNLLIHTPSDPFDPMLIVLQGGDINNEYRSSSSSSTLPFGLLIIFSLKVLDQGKVARCLLGGSRLFRTYRIRSIIRGIVRSLIGGVIF